MQNMDEIKVQVQLHGAVQMNTGLAKQVVTLPAYATIADLLRWLTQMHSSLKPLLEGEEQSLSLLILLNSLDIKRKNGLQTKLANEDLVDIVSMLSGG